MTSACEEGEDAEEEGGEEEEDEEGGEQDSEYSDESSDSSSSDEDDLDLTLQRELAAGGNKAALVALMKAAPRGSCDFPSLNMQARSRVGWD